MSEGTRWSVAARGVIEALEVAWSCLEAGDVASARPALAVARRDGARLARLAARDGEAEADAALRDQLAAVAARWPALSARLAERDAPDDVVDAGLPLVWDVAADVVVLAGRGQAHLVGALRARGQERIVWVSDEPAPDGVVAATDATALRSVLLGLVVAPDPERFHLFAEGPSPIPVEELQAATQRTLQTAEYHLGTRNRFREAWVRQSIAGLPVFARAASVAILGERFAGMPFVVVSPGPSLDRNLHQLAALQGRAVICAVNQSVRPLLRAGIVPDLVMGVDPQDYSSHLAGLDLAGVAAVVLPVTTHSGVLAAVRGPPLLSYFASGEETWLGGLLDEQVTLPSGGSVSNSAAALGVALGCSPVLLVGQDLAFTGQRMYARDSTLGALSVAPGADGAARVSLPDAGAVPGGAEYFEMPGWTEVPAWGGGTVWSSSDFIEFRRFFESLAAEHPAATYWNCTEGGAHIAGWAHLPLAEAAARLTGAVDVRAAVAAGLAATPERLASTREATAQRSAYVDTLATLCDRALQLQALAATDPAAAALFQQTQATVFEILDILPETALLLQVRAAEVLAEMRDARDEAEADALTRRLIHAIGAIAVQLGGDYRAALLGLGAP
jgi:hypothetical protein